MPKRILYVHACAGLGGAPLSLLYLIEQLDRRRYAPEVLFLGADGEEVDLFRRRGIPIRLRSDITSYPHARTAHLSLRSLRPWEFVARPLQILPSARRMRDELRARPTDLVHINTSVLLPAGLGAVWAGVPVVWHVREPLHPGILGLRHYLVRTCIDRCSRAVIAISRSDAALLAQGEKLHVVYNFVDFEHFDRLKDGRNFRSSLGVAPRRPLVLMLGGVLPTKGAEVLLEAAAMVRVKQPDVLFVIAGPAGGGESPSAVKRQMRRLVEWTRMVPNVERRVHRLKDALCLGKNVIFVGMRLDVPDMLAASDLLVWPAIVPHFARPILEAGAMGRPVIASDFSSSREQVVHGRTGLLVAPGHARALAEAILRLLDHPEEAKAMGEAGYALARERHDARVNVPAILALYEEIFATGQSAVVPR